MQSEHSPTRSSTIISDTNTSNRKDPSSNYEENTTETNFADDERITKRFLFSTIVAALGPGFQHGYCLGVTNTPQKILIEWIGNQSKSYDKDLDTQAAGHWQEEATFIFSIMVSVYSVGGILGGLSIYFWNRNVGFKKIFLYCNALAVIASFLVGFSKFQQSFTMLLLGRFLMGVNNGFCSGVVIIYLAEISPTKIRGTMCSVYQLFITVSIMVSQFVSIDVGLGSIESWPILFFLPTAVAVTQFLLLPFCMDPPLYLYENGRTSAAKEGSQYAVFERGSSHYFFPYWYKLEKIINLLAPLLYIYTAIRKLYGAELEEVKFAKLALRVHYQMRKDKPSFGELFSRVKYQTPLVISCVIMFAQQITGINVIINYTTVALYVINLRHISQVVILIIGIVNVCVTIISVALVDVVGRRWLLIFSFATMFIDMLALYICIVFGQYCEWRLLSLMTIILMTMYVAFFASGAGSIPWFLYTEFFLENMRPLAASVVVPVNWLTHFVIGVPFLSFHNKLGPSIFFTFAVMDFFLLIYIVRNVPETNNQQVVAIMTQFSPNRHSSLQVTNHHSSLQVTN